jgi:hypothetical protein
MSLTILMVLGALIGIINFLVLLFALLTGKKPWIGLLRAALCVSESVDKAPRCQWVCRDFECSSCRPATRHLIALTALTLRPIRAATSASGAVSSRSSSRCFQPLFLSSASPP